MIKKKFENKNKSQRFVILIPQKGFHVNSSVTAVFDKKFYRWKRECFGSKNFFIIPMKIRKFFFPLWSFNKLEYFFLCVKSMRDLKHHSRTCLQYFPKNSIFIYLKFCPLKQYIMKLIPKFVMKKNQQIYCVITVACDDFPSFYDEGKKKVCFCYLSLVIFCTQ